MTTASSTVPVTDTIGYVRVSTEQQAGEDRTSLPEQRRAIIERARTLGRLLDAAAVFEDAGVSGATAVRRPGFMAMLAYCEQHPRSKKEAGVIVVLNDSRFGRFEDLKEAAHWRWVLEQLGWFVRFCEADDIEHGMARELLRTIGSAQAGEYRLNLKRTARRSARATAQEGRWQNEAPLGYRRLATRHDGSQRVLEPGQRKADDEVVRLTPGPEDEQAIVRFMFETYATGMMTLGSLTRMLQARYPLLRRWSRGNTNAILKNPAYVGDVVWCRRPHDLDERKERRIRDRAEWVVCAGAHPELISRALFARVADRLAANKRETRATAGGYPLSGLVRCAHCGDVFTGGGGRKGPADDPDRYRFYRDRGSVVEATHRQAGDCHARRCTGFIATLRKRWLEAAVVRAIATVVSDPRVQAAIADAIDTEIAAATGDSLERRGHLTAELERLSGERARIIAAIGKGSILEREAAAVLAELRGRIEAIEAELSRVRFEQRRTANASKVRDLVLAAARDFEGQALKASGPQLRELVRHWLGDAVMNKETRVLTLYIRKVPDMFGMELDGPRRRDGRKDSRRFIVRRLTVPDSPLVARAKRRQAGAR